MIPTVFLDIVVVLGIAALFIAVWVWISLLRERRKQRAGPNPLAIHRAGWDYEVDGKPIALLIYAGEPEDRNQFFVPFDVSIVPSHEEEVARLLYRSNHRDPDDARIQYRSRGQKELLLVDSQVLVGYDSGSRVKLKVYPAAKP